MRIKIICPECSSGGYAQFHLRAFQDIGLYDGTCPEGHALLVATQTLRHEMLFEIALNAISDGYYREAIASFSAALERYFEFAIRILCDHQGIPSLTATALWKTVGAQSERQLGAYAFVFAMIFHKAPTLLPSHEVTLRNKVVHKGYLPILGEAISFGQIVHDIIQDSVQLLRLECMNSVDAIMGQQMQAAMEAMGTRYPRSFMVTPTTLNVIDDISAGYKSFHSILADRSMRSAPNTSIPQSAIPINPQAARNPIT